MKRAIARVSVNSRVLPLNKVQQLGHTKKKNYVKHRESHQSTNRTPNRSHTIEVVGGNSFIKEVNVLYK